MKIIEPAKIRGNIKTMQKKNVTLIYEAKLDGSRYVLYKIGNEIKLLGRNKSKVSGKFVDKINNVKHIKEWALNIEDDFIIDGEIWHRDGFGVCAGIMNSKLERSEQIQNKKGKLFYYLFDIIKLNDEDLRKNTYINRRSKLMDFINDNKNDYIRIVPVIGSSDIEDVDSAFSDAINVGWEGLVIKTSNGAYKDSEWAKKKAEKTYDYVITGFINSESEKYKGKGIAAIKLGLYDGDCLEEVGKCSGMSDFWRSEFYNDTEKFINKVIEVKGQEMFSTGSLRHPNFVRIRDDLTPKEQTFQKYGLRKKQNKLDLF